MSFPAESVYAGNFSTLEDPAEAAASGRRGSGRRRPVLGAPRRSSAWETPSRWRARGIVNKNLRAFWGARVNGSGRLNAGIANGGSTYGPGPGNISVGGITYDSREIYLQRNDFIGSLSSPLPVAAFAIRRLSPFIFHPAIFLFSREIFLFKLTLRLTRSDE